MKTEQKLKIILPVLLIVTAVSGMVIGNVPVPMKDFFTVIGAKLSGNEIPAELKSTEKILFVLRIPRTMMMILAGAALACSGASYQGLFRNPLADPYLIGISSGAGLGAVIALTIRWPYSTLGTLMTPVFAFLFAILAVIIVFSLGRMGGYLNVTGLLLAGMAVNAFASAMTSAWMLLSGGELKRSFSWMLGGSGSSGWKEVLIAAPLILIGILGQIRYAYPLNIIQFGEEQALQLGVSVKKVRLTVIFFATLATAAAISFTGVIGFIGLIVPHLIRLLVGNDYRKLIPLSVLGGAFFLTAADILARVVMAPRELPVGIITALTGAPFFLWILNRSNQAKV